MTRTRRQKPSWNWLMNEAEHTADGIYLFESEAAVQAWMTGLIVAAMMTDPVLSNIDAKVFDVMESHTAITRGPVKQALDIRV